MEEVRYILKKSLDNKLKIVLAIILALGLACCYLYLRSPKYKTYASVTLYEDSKTPSSLVKQFSIGNMLGGSGSVYNELEFLSSHTTMMRVVENLGLNITYYKKTGFLKKQLLYPDAPITLLPTNNIADTLSSVLLFRVEADKNGKCNVSVKADGKKILSASGELPMLLNTDFGEFQLKRSSDSLMKLPVVETIIFQSYSSASEEYLENVTFDIPVKLADVVNMSYTSKNKILGTDLLSAIIKEYNIRGVEDAKEKAEQQLKFIDDRIISLINELSESERGIQDFKERNNLSDISSDIKYLIEKKGLIEKELLTARAENEILNSALTFLRDPSNEYSLLPSVMSSFDENSAMEDYNKLILERLNLARSARPGNESLVKLDEQIGALRNNIISIFSRLKINSDLKITELNNSLSSTDFQIRKIPGQENVYRDIFRDQSLKEQLYVFLLEQREEMAMTLMNTTGRGKIVDKPYISTRDTEKSGIFYLFIAFIAGLLFFPVIWYLKLLLSQKE